jgi:hypothetical protein
MILTGETEVRVVKHYIAAVVPISCVLFRIAD